MTTKANDFYMQGGLPAATDLDTTFHLTGPLQLGFPAGAAAAPTITVAHGSYTMTAIPGAAVAAYRAHTGLVMVTEGTAKGMLIRDTLLVMRDLNFISPAGRTTTASCRGLRWTHTPRTTRRPLATEHDPGWLYFNAGLGPSAGYEDDEISPHLRAGAMRRLGAQRHHACRKWHNAAVPAHTMLPQVARTQPCLHTAAASGTHSSPACTLTGTHAACTSAGATACASAGATARASAGATAGTNAGAECLY